MPEHCLAILHSEKSCGASRRHVLAAQTTQIEECHIYNLKSKAVAEF